MADSQTPKSTHIAQQNLHQGGQEEGGISGSAGAAQPRSSLGASEAARAVQADAAEPAVTDQVDEAIVESAAAAAGGGNRPHEMPTAGNVQVGETGDLNELAKARRLSKEGKASTSLGGEAPSS